MSSEITSEERAAINAAIEAGKITKIERGVSAIPLPVWTGKKLEYRTAEDAEINARNSAWRKTRKVPAIVLQRRAIVSKLHGEGLTATQISRQIGLNSKSVYQHLTALGLKAHTLHDWAAEKAERQRIVAEMIGQGFHIGQIQERCGVSRNTIKGDLTELGLKSPFSPKVRKPATYDTELFRELYFSGMTLPKIADAFGVSIVTINKRRRALGLPGRNGGTEQ